jgi:cytoskeletal protein CcmA (bactofilin family)
MFNKLRSKQSDNDDNSSDRKKSRNTSIDYDELSMNVISQGSEIIGTLRSRRNIKVAGKIDGGIEATGKVIVTSTGYVEGIINCEEAYIAGSVGSEIHASEKVALASTAVVKSDLHTSSLSIEEGAIFVGFSHMAEKEPTTDDEKWQPDTTDDIKDVEDELFEETDGEPQEEETNNEVKTED